MSQPKVYMPLFIGDYLADTSDLSAEEHGAYLLLLMTMWRRGGSLPSDGDRLARIASVDSERWPAIWAVLGPFFVEKDDEITQQRLTRELEAARDRKAAATRRAQHAARQRWARERSTDGGRADLDSAPGDAPSDAPTNPPGDAERNASRMPEALPRAMPEAMPEAMRDAMPGAMREAMPEQCPSTSTSTSSSTSAAETIRFESMTTLLLVRFWSTGTTPQSDAGTRGPGTASSSESGASRLGFYRFVPRRRRENASA